jgi:hypothetical protein
MLLEGVKLYFYTGSLLNLFSTINEIKFNKEPV